MSSLTHDVDETDSTDPTTEHETAADVKGTLMERHDFDTTSFIGGVIFVTLGVYVMANGRFKDLNSFDWVFPVLIVIIGGGIVFSIVRSALADRAEERRFAEELASSFDDGFSGDGESSSEIVG